MTRSEGVISVVDHLSARARKIADDGYSKTDILKSAMSDLKALGGIGGMLSIMTTGDLSAKQRELAERLAVKVIAFLGITESAK